ncbi:MAG: hypothetical protein QQN63_02200 [Nitrosopumilus sp.]
MTNQAPHELSEQQLEACVYKLIRSQDTEAAQQIIMHHIPVAYKCAATIAKRHAPARRDDIKAASMLGLVQSVKWIRSGRLSHPDGVTAYVASCCYSAISNFIEFDRVIRIPHASYNNLKKDMSDDEYPGIQVTLLSQVGNQYGHEDIAIPHPATPSTAEPEALTKEIMERICFSDQDRDTLTMRMDNRTYDEIAIHLKCTKGYVQKLIHHLRQRYNEHLEAA